MRFDAAGLAAMGLMIVLMADVRRMLSGLCRESTTEHSKCGARVLDVFDAWCYHG